MFASHFYGCRNYSESLRRAKPDGLELGIMRLQVLVVMILGGSLWASAQSVRIDLEPFIASGLNQPLYLTNAHDGTNRRFVVEQPGRVSVMQPGSSMRMTFLDITGRVLSGGERGLLGLAFHPQFATNRRFFVDYTRRPDGATVIAEYRVSTSNPNVAETSETVLLLIPQPYENHNGGMIEFGPDGYLYIGMSDGGSGNDPQNRAQNPMPLISSGRIDALNTAIAIANPNAQAVTLNFYFTGVAGNNFGQGSTILPPNSQVAAFLDQPPFGANRESQATFTFMSALPVSALALRGITNERGDFLMTTLSVVDISNGPDAFSVPAPAQTIAQFVDGRGWATEIVLINPLNKAISGSIQAFNPDGQPAFVPFAGPYTIPAAGFLRFRTAGTGVNVRSGSIRITPSADSPAPSSTAILSFRNNGITILQTAIPGVASGTAFRLFVENLGTLNSVPGSIQTAIAVANPTSNPASAALELYGNDGAPVGLRDSIAIPANGQIAVFLNQIPGFSRLPPSFQGVLRISSASMVAVNALRARYNERGDFLISPTLPVSEAELPNSPELLFPHFAIGGGCEMQFVLFSGRAAASSGTIYFFDQNGTPLSLALRL